MLRSGTLMLRYGTLMLCCRTVRKEDVTPTRHVTPTHHWTPLLPGLALVVMKAN